METAARTRCKEVRMSPEYLSVGVESSSEPIVEEEDKCDTKLGQKKIVGRLARY